MVVGVVKVVQVGVARMPFEGGLSEFKFLLAQHNKAITRAALSLNFQHQFSEVYKEPEFSEYDSTFTTSNCHL